MIMGILIFLLLLGISIEIIGLARIARRISIYALNKPWKIEEIGGKEKW